MDLLQKRYSCGTLQYSLLTLTIAMGLILLGFFTYTFSCACVGQIIPLKLKELGASGKSIAFIMSTIGGVFNITICPMVSFKSDRFRSRFGRRIPFILATLPMFCASFILFGYSDAIGTALLPLLQQWGRVSPATMTVVVIGVIMAVYQFFLMFVGSVIYYIYNDVIPPQFLARIVGMVQVATTLAGALFNYCIFKYSLTHFRPVMILAAVVYAVGLGLMCFLLKEPEYPPVNEQEKKQSQGLAGVATFVRESFSHPFYWYAFWGGAAFAVSGMIGPFNVFFSQEMGLTLENIGSLNGTMGLFATAMSMAAAICCTVFIDRYHPMRMYVFTLFFAILAPLSNFKWIFITPSAQVYWYISLMTGIAGMVLSLFMGLASLPMLMRVFPKSRFGQFCSAQAMLRSGMTLVFGLGAGFYVDFLIKDIGLADKAYRYLSAWQVAWYLLALFCFAMMYREWLKLGGDDHYKAPAPWAPEKYEEMPVTPVIKPVERYVRWSMNLLDLTFCLSLCGAIALYFLADNYGFASEKYWSLRLAIPAAAGALVLWIVVRGLIIRDIRRAVRGENTKNGIPHHGILWIIGIKHFLLLGVCVYQSWATLNATSNGISAKLWAAEAFLNIALIALIYLYTLIERGFPTPLQQESEPSQI